MQFEAWPEAGPTDGPKRSLFERISVIKYYSFWHLPKSSFPGPLKHQRVSKTCISPDERHFDWMFCCPRPGRFEMFKNA